MLNQTEKRAARLMGERFVDDETAAKAVGLSVDEIRALRANPEFQEAIDKALGEGAKETAAAMFGGGRDD